MFSWYCFFKTSKLGSPVSECWLHTRCQPGLHTCLPSAWSVLWLLLVGVTAQAPGIWGPDPLLSEDAGAAACPFLSWLTFFPFTSWSPEPMAGHHIGNPHPDVIPDTLSSTYTLFRFWNVNSSWLARMPLWPKPLLLVALLPGSVTHFVYLLHLWPLTSGIPHFSEHSHMGMTLPNFRPGLHYNPVMSLPWLSLLGLGLWLCFFFFLPFFLSTSGPRTLW